MYFFELQITNIDYLGGLYSLNTLWSETLEPGKKKKNFKNQQVFGGGGVTGGEPQVNWDYNPVNFSFKESILDVHHKTILFWKWDL